jgi:hypothetical protein
VARREPATTGAIRRGVEWSSVVLVIATSTLAHSG